jgi:hypothetical protein
MIQMIVTISKGNYQRTILATNEDYRTIKELTDALASSDTGFIKFSRPAVLQQDNHSGPKPTLVIVPDNLQEDIYVDSKAVVHVAKMIPELLKQYKLAVKTVGEEMAGEIISE